MAESEFPNLVTILAHRFKGGALEGLLVRNENVIFSLLAAALLAILALAATRKKAMVPAALQNAAEAFVEIVDDFVCGILGEKGRRFTPFIGTLFIYILCMNYIGLIPLCKASTASLSTTLALGLCVFGYVQYTAFRELGVKKYLDYLAGHPRGFVAWTVVVPILMFFIHIITELVRPLTLSLRLRSNIWGDDYLLALLAGYGIKGVPLLFFSTLITVLAGLVQAMVFCILATVYFALVVEHEETETTREVKHGL